MLSAPRGAKKQRDVGDVARPGDEVIEEMAHVARVEVPVLFSVPVLAPKILGRNRDGESMART